MNATDVSATEKSMALGQELRLARAIAANQLPFFADALFTARLVLSDKLPGLAAVDKFMRVYFNPNIIEDCMAGISLEVRTRQLAWVWVHEISHVLREHHARGLSINAEPTTWNIACDIEINDNHFHKLYPPASYKIITHGTYDFEPNHIAEYYYRALQTSPLLPKSFSTPNEGSGVHGCACHWELPFSDPNSPGVSIAHQHSLIEMTARAIQSQRWGNVPADWSRWAAEQLPKVDWRAVLSKKLKNALSLNTSRKTSYSFHRPNRRCAAFAPFVRPSLYAPPASHVAVVIDTSGSICSSMLSQFMGEVRGILQQSSSVITVVPCDTVAYEPIQIRTAEDVSEVTKKLRGGGGTDMMPGIEAASKLAPKPAVIIVLTDGFVDFPESCPVQIGVVFAIVEAYYLQAKSRAPAWVQSGMIAIPLADQSDQ